MHPRIVVLDGLPLNPGDLRWDALARLGDLTVHDRTPPDLVRERARDAEIVLTNKVVLDAATLADLPRLRFVCVMATGTNAVDLAAATARGIVVANVPAYSTRSVAQHVFALILELTQRVGHHARTVREGRWSDGESDWCYWDGTLIELDGKTLGIVGYGRIGRAVGDLARAFGMNVLVSTRTSNNLDAVFAESDFVSLHCPLTPETQNLVDADRLARMKPTAFLINTGRGPLIDESALADALNTGRIAGAGLDVLAVEPPSPENPLLSARNCVITPHLAWATTASRSRLMAVLEANVAAFLRGEPQNVVR